ncbi:MAG: DUF192 domain-containing protein [Alphaproteobacteria bacterium]|nr:DUF192 domain-containing protein [Alphaproteobacteria bacterium]
MHTLQRAAIGMTVFLGLAAAPVPSQLPNATVVVDVPGGHARLRVEIASDNATRLRGLMYRKQLDADSGMLFDFHNDGFRNFWMKNTVLPLDLLFIRSDGTISSIVANTTPFSENIISSEEPVRAVLEINAGRAAALGLKPGEKVHSAVFANMLQGQ